MIVAVIDCGTNTFNLVIMNIGEDGTRTHVYNDRVPVKLGEDSINRNMIARSAYKRGMLALAEFQSAIKHYQVDRTIAIATSAIRDAKNRKEFIMKAMMDYEIDIQVINGDKEAELIYLGVRDAVKLAKEPSLIMDVGGGSTEFILADAEKVIWKSSFNIGVARLLEKFNPSDPIKAREVSDMEEFLTEQLQPLFVFLEGKNVQELIGSSGAFESLLEMIHGELGGAEFNNSVTEYDVNLQDYHKIAQRIIRSTIVERKRIGSLVPMRRDMIVIFFVMVDVVMKKFRFPKLRVSSYSLKEGAIVDLMNGSKLLK
jgi:exopolyphosphatase/guanosine-5'-triphosphate,3'-diphosphate pyrophosphatase